MTAIADYGVGNLFSLKSSFAAAGAEACVTADAEVLRAADRIVLPGVGAFADAAQKLKSSGLGEAVAREAALGKPILGICLGMQLLFDKSFEFGEHAGLGLISGTVRPISKMIPRGLKIPHIGWNGLHFGEKKHPLFRYLRENDCVYFVHSFAAAECEKSVIATADYGTELVAAAARGNVMGCQFHPEKSGDVGISILKAFCEMRGEDLC